MLKINASYFQPHSKLTFGALAIFTRPLWTKQLVVTPPFLIWYIYMETCSLRDINMHLNKSSCTKMTKINAQREKRRYHLLCDKTLGQWSAISNINPIYFPNTPETTGQTALTSPTPRRLDMYEIYMSFDIADSQEWKHCYQNCRPSYFFCYTPYTTMVS